MTGAEVRRASILMAAGTVLSRALGFIRAIVLASAIGLVASTGANMFSIANQLPNTIYAIVAGGVLSAIFVPQIVRASAAVDGGEAYVNKLLTVCIVLLAGTTLVATLAAPLLTALYGTRLDSDALALATAFAYWCLPQIFFYGLYTIFGEVLNARRVFGPYTWAPVLNNIVGIAGLGVFIWVFGTYPSGGRPAAAWSTGMIAVLGATTTLGVMAQALILLLAFRRAQIHFRFDWHWRGHGLGTAGRLAGWTFGMLVLTTIAGIVETNVAGIASNSNHASIAALGSAWLIFMLPHSVISVSIATAYFTRMSEHASRNDFAQLRSDLGSATRSISMLILLAAAVIVVCSPYLGAVFMPGDTTGIAAFGSVVVAYTLGLLPFSLLFLVQRVFYTLGDTRTPFLYTVFQVLLICAGCVVIAELPGEHIAVAIALLVTLAGTLQLIAAGVLLRRRIGGLGGSVVGRSLLRSVGAIVPALFVGILTSAAITTVSAQASFDPSSRWGAMLSMLVIAAVMAAVYGGALLGLRSPELRALAHEWRARRNG